MSQALYKRELIKPDGRSLTLYADHPLAEGIQATNPRQDRPSGSPHLRWHPLRQEWVAFASHRQNRTFLPPKEYNPLAPTRSAEFPTELPAGEYDIAVFDNLFASLKLDATADLPEETVPLRPADGHCEVVVFTQDSGASLAQLPVKHIELLLRVWADRYDQIRKHRHIQYILPFENRGVEVGVTLHHPHGQIYAYPVIPPVPAQMLCAQAEHYERTGRTLLSDFLEEELNAAKRVIHQGHSTAAFIPACARYPYEVWIVPERPVADLAQMTAREITDFARTLKTVLLKYDRLWSRPFPYLMALYAAPVNGDPHPEWHFHIEFYPPYRSRDRLKYLAGTELAAGLFVNDSLPEEKAAELRQVEVTDADL